MLDTTSIFGRGTSDELNTRMSVNIIPRPLGVTVGPADATGCVLNDGLVISYAPALVGEARWFQRVLETGTGWTVHLAPIDVVTDATIELAPAAEIELPHGNTSSIPNFAREAAYRLRASDGRIVISAPGSEGAFYALQTLRQLLPDSTFADSTLSQPISIPKLDIVDAPRMAWRGVLFDVARHFMPKNFILKLIELIALHKCNVLQLHLTDDQGWRFEVEGYPLLTEVGAWRVGSPPDVEGDIGQPLYGGFYSRDDLEEIVAYATELHVQVLPEIDMPGHMLAAIASYPAFGNTGEQFNVSPTWGVSTHVLNLEAETVRFCTDVLDQVAVIFPGSLLHIGGDECPTTEWKTNARAQEIMRTEGYVDEVQLQGWFTARIADYLAQLDRRVVAWDDVLESTVPPDAVLMAWQDEARGAEAVASGHHVVMVPQQWLYFDRPESTDPDEPVGFPGVTTLEDVYLHDPVPANIPIVDRHRVLGAQCQLWTEYVSSPSEAEYRYFPRLCAFAEVAWSIESPERPKSYEEFEGRLRHHLERLTAMDVTFRPLLEPRHH
jgi:hexosaminidase